MLNLTYLAVLEPGEDGSYGISFPDLPGCFSFSDNLMDVGKMEAEAAELHIYGMEREGEMIPSPSVTLSQEQKVNFSRLLETALLDYLQIPKAKR